MLDIHTTLKFHIDGDGAKMQPDGFYTVWKKDKHLFDAFRT